MQTNMLLWYVVCVGGGLIGSLGVVWAWDMGHGGARCVVGDVLGTFWGAGSWTVRVC